MGVSLGPEEQLGLSQRVWDRDSLPEALEICLELGRAFCRELGAEEESIGAVGLKDSP